MSEHSDQDVPGGSAQSAGRVLSGLGLNGDRQEDFVAVFHASPTALAYTPDARCDVVWRNRAMDPLVPPSFDWRQWRLPGGTAPDVRVAGEPLASERQPLRLAAQRGVSTRDLEIELRWPGHEPRFLRVSAEPLRTASGRPCGAVASAVDISAAKRAEADSRAKDELLAVLGHEMRNPLNAIATAIEVMNRVAPASPESQSARKIIGRQTRGLAQLLDELGLIGRSMAGEIQLLRQPLELGALTRRCVMRVETAAAQRGQTLTVMAVEVWVCADAERLAQAIDRLLDGAVRATPSGSRIELQLSSVAGPTGAEAVLAVREASVDREPASLPHAAIPPTPAPRRFDRPGGGRGLGWSLGRSLIERHGGWLDADATAGGAHNFAIRLPATPAPEAVHDPRAAPPARVGVIEDNPDALFGVCALLELNGHAVTTAGDGPSGVEMLLRDAPDVALVDLGLPGFDGYEVARRSRAAGFRGRLIALSGQGAGSHSNESLAAGFEAHLVKPVDSERLSRLFDA